MKKILTIAGSDPSGGAGIQADIKTITVHGMYACSVITSLTAQNTTGVYGILNVPPEFVAAQMDCVFTDIYPDAVKIGMVSEEPILAQIIAGLQQYRPQNLVIDPVMISTSGRRLLSEPAFSLLKEELLPLGTLITPNLPGGTHEQPAAEPSSHKILHKFFSRGQKVVTIEWCIYCAVKK